MPQFIFHITHGYDAVLVENGIPQIPFGIPGIPQIPRSSSLKPVDVTFQLCRYDEGFQDGEDPGLSSGPNVITRSF